jgi:hypothetical protein
VEVIKGYKGENRVKRRRGEERCRGREEKRNLGIKSRRDRNCRAEIMQETGREKGDRQ